VKIKKIRTSHFSVRQLVTLGILLSLVLSLPVLVWGLLTQNLDWRKKAASGELPTKFGELQAVTSSRLFLGQTNQVNIGFRTGSDVSNVKTISSISLRLSYPYQTTAPEVDVTDENGNPIAAIFPNTDLVSQDWSFAVNEVRHEAGQVVIDFSAINLNPGGFQTTTITNLATFYLTANAIPTGGEITFSFDPDQTKMLSKVEPVEDIIGLTMEPIITILEQNTVLSGVSFKAQGVTSSASGGPHQFFDITLENSQETKTYALEMQVDSEGILRAVGDLDLYDLAIDESGTAFTVYAKDQSHLRKELGPITLYPSQNMYDQAWINKTVLAGDLDGNNILNILDIGRILSVYTALSVPVTQINEVSDLNLDGVINILDIGLILANYTALEVPGD